MEREVYSYLLMAWVGVAACVFIALQFLTAPYGRHARAGWGPTIHRTAGWVIMESPAVIVFAACFLVSDRRRDPGRDRLPAALAPALRLPRLHLSVPPAGWPVAHAPERSGDGVPLQRDERLPAGARPLHLRARRAAWNGSAIRGSSLGWCCSWADMRSTSSRTSSSAHSAPRARAATGSRMAARSRSSPVPTTRASSSSGSAGRCSPGLRRASSSSCGLRRTWCRGRGRITAGTWNDSPTIRAERKAVIPWLY